ncbi:MAG: hypothetical protein GX557_07590 [Chloroflexi bacterium]|nr:hypothetical protein [Chloroflexota bacterium]
MTRARWQCLCALILTIALGGCALVQPGTPSATWEPLPTVDGATLVVAVGASPTPEPSAEPKDTATVAAVSTPVTTATTAVTPTRTATLAPTAPAQPTASPSPQRVDGWRGVLHSLAPEALYDDYFQLAGDTRQYGITSADAALAERLVELRDTGRLLTVWGQLWLPAEDYGGGQIVVERLEAGTTPTVTPRPSATPTRTRTTLPTVAPTSAPTATASPPPTNSATPRPAASPTATRAATSRPRPPAATPQPSELVEGWVGVVTALPEGSAYDDYFACESPGGQYGIDSLVPAIATQLAAHRASACRIRVWGVLDFGVADHGGTRITVTRLEIAGP